MKRALFVALATVVAASTYAGSHPIKPYIKKDGTYVAPSRATNPNATKADNYSTKGNVNPYTGKPGTKNPEKK